VHEAWKLYEPVFLPGQGSPVPLPERSAIVGDLAGEVRRLAEREILGKAASLEAEVERSQRSPKALNALGALYARYDLRDRAEAKFREAIATQDFVPALLNLGSLEFIRPDMEGALSWYQRAYAQAPRDPKVLVCLARASHALEDYRTAKKSFEELKSIDPDLAAKYSYLELKGEESLRAAAASGAQDSAFWVE
jgi:Flp pilus assembly protein TadD